MPYDPSHHHRRSIRLANYDYRQAGAYFVTICTYGRQSLLSVICNKRVQLSPIGTFVARTWVHLPEHFDHVTLDAWVVMPDHLHGIILFEHQSDRASRSRSGAQAGSLAAVVQNFKAVATRKVRQHDLITSAPLWQRNYYERIIRNDTELNATRSYIENNPARWSHAQAGR